MPNFKSDYEDLENIKASHVNTVIFNLHQIKRRAFFFWDTRYKETFLEKTFEQMENFVVNATVSVTDCFHNMHFICLCERNSSTV